MCVHGTSMEALRNIVRSGGLDRMQRHAIQMAIGLPEDSNVRSGIRAECEILIYVDVARAMAQHGLPFYLSSNRVICCPGPIPLDCFLRVIRRRDGSFVDISCL